MRASVLIGLALVAVGFVALYQVKNGFLMSTIGAAYYAPPEDEAALRQAFADLGGRDGAESGYRLSQIARARVACARREIDEQPSDVTVEAFYRMNLMILGAGVNQLSAVIDPEVHYVGEIRRSLLRETAPWRDSRLTTGEERRLENIFERITAVKHPAYADLPLGDGFNHFALRLLTEALLTKGDAINACIADVKAG